MSRTEALAAVALSTAAAGASWFILARAATDGAALALIPWMAAVLPLSAISLPRRWPVEVSAVLLVVASLMPESQVRLIVAGALFAFALGFALWSHEGSGITTSFLVAAGAVPLLVIGLPGKLVWFGVVAVAGVVILEKLLREEGAPSREVRVLTGAAVLLLASVLPVGSMRQALLPLAIATALFVRSRTGRLSPLIALLAGLVCGLWQGLLLGVSNLAFGLMRRRTDLEAHAMAPVWIGAAASLGILPPLVFGSAAWVRARLPDLLTLLVAVALALVVRPAIVPLVVLAGAILVLAGGRLSRSQHDLGTALPLFAGATLAIIAVGMAGAFRMGVPLGLPVVPAFLIGLASLSVLTGRMAGVLITTSGLVIMSLLPTPIRLDGATSLTAGESVAFRADARVSVVRVALSGVELSGARAGRQVAEISVLDAAGEGRAVPVRVGDLADWGAFRPRYLYRTRNSLPDKSARRIGGVGAGAWLHGAGVVEIETEGPVTGVRVTAGDLEGEERILVHSVRWSGAGR